jgi:hypothetical protein
LVLVRQVLIVAGNGEGNGPVVEHASGVDNHSSNNDCASRGDG